MARPTAWIAAAIATAAIPTNIEAQAQPTLASAEAVFETTTDDKDHDSLVTVTVKRGDLAARTKTKLSLSTNGSDK